MAHEGARSSKITYLGTKEKLVSVGFTKQSQRQFKVWDPRNLTKEIKKMDIDQAAGARVCGCVGAGARPAGRAGGAQAVPACFCLLSFLYSCCTRCLIALHMGKQVTADSNGVLKLNSIRHLWAVLPSLYP